MTPRERFHACVHFEAVDRVPRKASYVEALRERLTAHLGVDPDAYFETDQGRMGGLRPPDGYVAPDYTVFHPEYAGRDDFRIDENGCGHLSRGFFHFTEYISPLRNCTRFEEIEAYPFPDKRDWSDDRLLAAVAAAHAEGRSAWVFTGHMYENAWQVRGYEPFLMDLLSQRDWAEYILDRFMLNNEATAVAAARAGCDCVMAGDDVANQNAMMFQPDLWREVMKPRWARVFAAARAIRPGIPIWYHSDGNLSAILDDLVEIGVTLLNPVQPECMDPLAIRRRFGKNLAFDGCIGTQTTFPFGTPEEMHWNVTALSEALDGLNGGLILSPTHVLEPEVPPENVVAFFEACDTLRGKEFQ